MSQPNDLRLPIRLVTGHSNDGSSVVESSIPENPPAKSDNAGMKITFCYATQGFPVSIANRNDISVYANFIRDPPGIVVPNGSACRLVDIPPDYESVMHRSISVNYNVVIEGEVELVLDSGERRLLKRGDCVVQRAINHAWANPSKTRWTRISAVSMPATEQWS